MSLRVSIVTAVEQNSARYLYVVFSLEYYYYFFLLLLSTTANLVTNSTKLEVPKVWWVGWPGQSPSLCRSLFLS